MRKNKSIIMLAVIIILIMCLPNAISMFNNQHTWQQKETITCTTCHADMKLNLESSQNHHHKAELLGVTNTDEACKYCHQAQFVSETGMQVNWTYESNSGNVHAVFTIECLDCHGDSKINDDVNAVKIADNFNSTSFEAHVPFYKGAASSVTMWGANEACIACHTGVTIQDAGHYISNRGLNYTAQKISGTWTVTFKIYNP